ncbi:MAG TPA: cytochrome c oxidase subunit II [Gemmatimonadales bacterium]|nr:cytochrome c oxidase subunit II [Gemmatimonadales bacterium]
MAFWARAFQTARRLAPVLLVALAMAACGGTSAEFPQSTLHPKSDLTGIIDGVFMNTVWWALLVFVLVEGALLYVIFRYRGKAGDGEPSQVHGNTLLEIIWTVIPALILAMISVPTVRAIFQTYEVPKGDALVVEVIGHQWWWEFRYPQYGVTTANELHVPVGRTVTLKMKTIDVLHSFWLPQLAAKRDVFPNRTTTIWFRADSAGYYSGQCAEFCGLQHARMAFHVAAGTPEEFDAYITGLRRTGAPVPADTTAPSTPSTASRAMTTTSLAAQQPPLREDSAPIAATQDTSAASAPDAVAQGAEIFRTRGGCIGCHTLDATSRATMVGPNLANIGSRRYIGAGTLLNTDENLARWIQNPQLIKPGILMQNMGLTLEQSRAVAAYLRTHK